MFKKNRGFTLIELLVVIAIIGILASVVIVNLNKAQKKGSDSAIKANLANLRSQAAMYYDDNGNYGTNLTGNVNCSVTSSGTEVGCTAGTLAGDSTVKAQLKSAAKAAGNTTRINIANTSGNGTAWAAFSPLKTDSTQNWCVDSLGKAATSSATITTDTAC